MSLSLCAMSHSPLLGHAEVAPALSDEIDHAFARARAAVTAFEPDLVVVFAPDHYNGFFYDVMPPFAVGLEARGVGDYGTSTAELQIPEDIARGMVAAAFDADIDVAVSLKMRLDHGAMQPLSALFGEDLDVPVVPVFINSVAPPLVGLRRVRALGSALGRYLTGLDRRVLLLGSGGLSHDPPVPTLQTADPAVRAGLIDGRDPAPEARAAREQRVHAAGAAFAAGARPDMRALNPEFDRRFLDVLARGELVDLDGWSNQSVGEQGGDSAQEIRTWVAAYAALRAAGPYRITDSYYRPIPELIAGFAVTGATPCSA